VLKHFLVCLAIACFSTSYDMARKGTKRTASKVGRKIGTGVAKKCRTIAASLKHAESVPQPVRSMLRDTLVRTFNTYKEERHAFQVTVSDTVGKVLKAEQAKFQTAISEATAKKSAAETEANSLSQASEGAHATSDAAAKGHADSQTAVSDSKAELKNAKSALHDLEAAAKAADAAASATSTKKGKLEVLSTDYVATIREGTKTGPAAGKHVGKELGGCGLEAEFITCVTTSFSKASSTWSTFDKLIDGKLEENLKQVLARFTAELATDESEKAARATAIESAKAAVLAGEEKVKAMEEACAIASTAAKEADAAAKTAAAALKKQQGEVAKAADALKHAEKDLESFNTHALAAYTELEARTPPPEPEQPAETAVDAAMEAAPPAAERSAAATMAASPGILLQRAAQAATQAVGRLASPRVA
jgi:chromosome segregation ATPase